MANMDQATPVTVIIRARLRGDPAAARQLHDQVTAATKEMALAAGDLSHRVFLSSSEPGVFLGIDEWRSAESVQAFASSSQITEFFAKLFDGPPDVSVWASSGWNEW